MSESYKEHPSLTTVVVDGRPVAMAEAQAADEVVWFAVQETVETVWEGLRCRALDDGTVALCAVPLFAYDLNFGDRITVISSAEGAIVAERRLEDAGNFTFRAHLRQPDLARLQDLIEEFGAMGCLIEGWSESLLGLGCSPDLAQQVANRLATYEDVGVLVYETGRR